MGFFAVAAIVAVFAIATVCVVMGWLDRRGRRRAARTIATGHGLPPDVAASLDRARRRAKRPDSAP